MFPHDDIQTLDTQCDDDETFEMDIEPVQSPTTSDIQPITCTQRSIKNVKNTKSKN